MLGDTMVDDPQERRPSVLPGRLKLVTIGPGVTVACSGLIDPAGVAVRTARRELRKAGISAVNEVLTQVSRCGNVDFLLACHAPETSLIRIRNGGLLEVNDICALGFDTPFRDIIDRARTSAETSPLSRSELRNRFIDRLMTNRDLGAHVGGFPIAVHAIPEGHRYLAFSGGYTYKFPTLRWGEVTHQPIEQVYTGDGHFEMSVIPSDTINVPVVGACLLQARTGFVFSPIERPEPFLIPLAAPNLAWKGHEREMYDVLKTALAAHVTATEQRE